VSFKIHHGGATLPMGLSLAGVHNALNAAGAVAVLLGLGFDFTESVAAVSSFGGTERRFELHGVRGEVSVYDDFAHHPAEVSAALQGARAAVGTGRLVTVFQPHLFSRTRIFAAEFAEALALSDEVVVTDIYAAREDPEPGVTGRLIVDKFADPRKVHYVPQWEDVAEAAVALAKPGDFIITMGCGDIYRMVPNLLAVLER
jgi:UDP-N-acetylmuramate--alanine ligase